MDYHRVLSSSIIWIILTAYTVMLLSPTRCQDVKDNCNVNGSSPCKNNGTCINITGDGNYSCNCTERFTGFNCQIEVCIRLYRSSPCKNNGTLYHRGLELFM